MARQLDKTLKKIIADIALEMNMDPVMVKNIIWSQFNYAARIIKQGGFDSIMFPYLGKFRVKPNRPLLLSKHKVRMATKKKNGLLRDTKQHANHQSGSPDD